MAYPVTGSYIIASISHAYYFDKRIYTITFENGNCIICPDIIAKRLDFHIGRFDDNILRDYNDKKLTEKINSSKNEKNMDKYEKTIKKLLEKYPDEFKFNVLGKNIYSDLHVDRNRDSSIPYFKTLG